MKEELEKLLDERVGSAWREWGIDNLLTHVYEVSHLGETDDGSWTVTTARLAAIYKSEQGRIRRTDDWNRRQAAKGKSDG